MKSKDILFLNVENAFGTGILQSMVLKPAIEISRKYGYEIGITTMYRNSEFTPGKLQLPEDVQVVNGRRSEKGISLGNVFLHTLFLIRVIFHSKHYKILHCRSYMATIIGLVCKKIWGMKVLFDVRGYLVDEAVESGKLRRGGAKYRLLKKMEHYIFLNADAIIAVSEEMSVDIQNRFSRNTTIIRNPANISLTNHQIILNSTKVISYNGSLNDWHLPQLFFATIKDISEQDSKYTFRVITSDTTKAEELSKQYEVPKDRITIKQCSAAEVVRQLRQGGLGWCVIRPSFSKSVCWPVKFNEYLAANLPVIVNKKIGDLEALVDRYRLGIVIDILENPSTIAKQILDYNSKTEIFSVADELALMISWEAQIVELNSVYEELLKNASH